MAISTTFTLKFAGAAVEKGLSRVQSAFNSLGGVAMRIGKSLISPFAGIAAAAGGLLAAGALMRTAVELNAVGEAARAGDRALANVTKQMGLFGSEAEDVTKRLIDYAEVTSRMTGVDGEAIGVTQTKLMTFKELAKSANVAGGAFDRATMAAIDMASAGFGSAETNAVQLGKALNDPIKGINSLTRSGITFTAQEKAKIKTLVESNQMLKAQDTILEAIETQVGGTAKETATSSGKIRESYAQIKDAFAEPFSMGIDSVPGALENAFPAIIAKAEELGKLFGMTIEETVNGDTKRLVMIGELIGDLILSGIKISLSRLSDVAGQSFLEMQEAIPVSGMGIASNILNLSEMHEKGAEVGRTRLIRESAESISQKYRQAVEMPPPAKQGPVPGAPGYRYAQHDEPATIMGDERVVRILETIERNLAPVP